MRLNPLPLFLALACGLALSSCETLEYLPGREPSYRRIIETNLRGEWTIAWVAEGPVQHTEQGWRFRAMERHVYNHPTLHIHYPLGRVVTVHAANVLVEPTEKPAWLEDLDARVDGGDARKAARLHGGTLSLE